MMCGVQVVAVLRESRVLTKIHFGGTAAPPKGGRGKQHHPKGGKEGKHHCPRGGGREAAPSNKGRGGKTAPPKEIVFVKTRAMMKF